MTRATSQRRALIYGWIAAKFQGLPDRALPDFFRDELRVKGPASADTIGRELQRVRGRNEHKLTSRSAEPDKADPAGTEDAPSASQAVWTDWLRVREDRLGLRKVLIRIPNDGFPLPGLFEALERTQGVRSIIETKEDREILAVALLRSGEDDEELRARIAEHVPDRAVRLHVVLRESDEPTGLTWHGIAEREAATEG